MKKILCPIDFSKAAMNGLEYAFEISKKFKSELVLFHAMHPKPALTEKTPLNLDEAYSNQEELVREKLEKLCEEMASNNFQDINYMFVVKTGFAEDKILDMVKEHNIDMIITGSKGADGIDTLFGTISGDLAVKATCPVIIVPADYKYKNIDEIIYTTDLTGDERNVSDYARRFAKTYKAHISILNIDKKHHEELEKFTKGGLGIVHKNDFMDLSFYVLEDKNIIEGISSFAEEQKADMIIMSAHKKSFLKKLFSQSHTKAISYTAEVPVMVLHKE